MSAQPDTEEVVAAREPLRLELLCPEARRSTAIGRHRPFPRPADERATQAPPHPSAGPRTSTPCPRAPPARAARCRRRPLHEPRDGAEFRRPGCHVGRPRPARLSDFVQPPPTASGAASRTTTSSARSPSAQTITARIVRSEHGRRPATGRPACLRPRRARRCPAAVAAVDRRRRLQRRAQRAASPPSRRTLLPRAAGQRARSRPARGLAFPTVPIYEYRCPNGDTFELFQKMISTRCRPRAPSAARGRWRSSSRRRALQGSSSTDYGRGAAQGLGLPSSSEKTADKPAE